MSNCPDASSKSAFRFDWLDRRDRVPEELVRLRIARGECLMEDRKWNGKPDLVLERVSEDLGTRPAPLTLAPGEVHAEGLQLKRADGRVIARQSTIVARRFTLPLLPVFVGYMPGAYFDFSRHQVPNSDVNVNAASFLGRFTDLKMAPPQSVDSGAVAARIDEVLADPLVPDTEGAFALIRDYFDSLSKGQVTSTDVRRLARLIADPRMKRFQLPIYKLDPSQRLELRNPILERLWQLGEAKEWLLYFQLAGNLRLMPAGAFRKAEPLVDRLLSEPELRRFAPVLVQRLAERGPAESARLLSILHEAFSTSYPTSRADDLYRYYQGDFINATLQGLCRLGPQAQPQAGKSMLETLSAIAASGSIPPSRQELDIWRATLVSLGASPTEFDPPGKRGFDPYHQKLQNIANSGCEQP